jgi:hypothetical protein
MNIANILTIPNVIEQIVYKTPVVACLGAFRVALSLVA